jgi:diaminopimelate decarboxylase
MHYFEYKDNELHAEDVPVRRICDEVGSPVFIYSKKTLERHFRTFGEPFQDMSHLICYSVKASSNLAILRLFANMGGGADIVSGGELYRAVKGGVDPAKIVYSGVGKTAGEMDQALEAGILMFNVESEEELELLDQRAQASGKKASISLRVNPDVDPKTHPYISTGLRSNKFGIEMGRCREIYFRAKDMPGLNPIGVDCHIGSQLTELGPFMEATEKVGGLIKDLKDGGLNIRYLDIGGGLGIPYENEEPPSPAEYGEAVIKLVKDLGVTLIVEPGRVIVGNAGILVSKVLFQKQGPEKRFVIIDAAMNDLMRPTLYKAYHEVRKVTRSSDDSQSASKITADLVGPICESGDFLAKDREIDEARSGELLAFMSAGAYGFSMSSNYNSRPRAAEVLVDGETYSVIRGRETYEDLIRGETIPASLLT